MSSRLCVQTALALGLLSFCGSLSYGQTCGSRANEFQTLNTPLIFKNEADWKRFNKDQYEFETQRAHEYIRRQLLEYLTAGKASTNDLEALIRCLQALPEYQSLRDETNTPAVFALGKSSSAFAAAYYLYRGASAIPDTRPYFEVYVKKSKDTWESVGEAVASFGRSTFFAYRLSPPRVDDQSWFLMSGFQIGDTGTRLRLELIAFDGKKLRTVSTISGLVQTTLAEVHPEYLILSQYEGFRDGHDLFKRRRLDVTPQGLREASAAH